MIIITILNIIGYLLILIAIDIKRPNEYKISKNINHWWTYILVFLGTLLTSSTNIFFNFIGYMVILFVVDYYRPHEYRLEFFTPDWWVMIVLLSFGTTFIN